MKNVFADFFNQRMKNKILRRAMLFCDNEKIILIRHKENCVVLLGVDRQVLPYKGLL